MASKKRQPAKSKRQSKKTPAMGVKPSARSAPSTRFRMYRHILITTDGSKLAHEAAVHASMECAGGSHVSRQRGVGLLLLTLRRTCPCLDENGPD